MDPTPILFGEDFPWGQRRRVSVAFGAALLLAAYGVDWKVKADCAFGLYLAGLAAFWGGLASMDSSSK